MAKLGTPSAIISRILNHSDGSSPAVTAVYNRYSYAAETAEALGDWAKYLAKVTGADEHSRLGSGGNTPCPELSDETTLKTGETI